jgi:hypothetical protein
MFVARRWHKTKQWRHLAGRNSKASVANAREESFEKAAAAKKAQSDKVNEWKLYHEQAEAAKLKKSKDKAEKDKAEKDVTFFLCTITTP